MYDRMWITWLDESGRVVAEHYNVSIEENLTERIHNVKRQLDNLSLEVKLRYA